MWSNPQETVDLVTINKEILNGKFHFLCSVGYEGDSSARLLKRLQWLCLAHKLPGVVL